MPRLLWFAEIKRGSDTVALTHGPWVEASDQRFVEGAWEGSFAASAPSAALVLTGTAGECNAEGIVFSTSTDTLDRLYALRRSDRMWVSNSLALLLATSGEDCDVSYRYYIHDFVTIRHGIREHARAIPTSGGNRVELYYHCNLQVDRDFNLTVRAKPRPPRFTTFREYRNFLTDAVRAVVLNASANERLVKYRPLVGISAGYDSPACAVLAREAGCTKAFTFVRARPGRAVDELDSGIHIGNILGYQIREFDRERYLTRSDRPEIEFLATGTGGGACMFSSMEDLLKGTIMITGDRGDTLWDRNSPRVSEEIKGGDPGCSLIEFRGRVGFLQLPVPFIGAVNHPDLHRISNSPEMRPWSLERDVYDRPIPRRVAEEAGIPREAFGNAKRAIAQVFHSMDGEHEPLETMLAPQSLSDFRAFYAAIPSEAKQRGIAWHRLMQTVFWKSIKVNRALTKLSGLFKRLSERHQVSPAPNDFTFHWAVHELTARYKRVLEGRQRV